MQEQDIEVSQSMLSEALAHMGAPFTLDVYRQTDGAWVIHIDTEEMEENSNGPTPLRVYINDDTDSPAYANPAYSQEPR